MSEIDQMRIGEAINREEHMIAARLFKARTRLGIARDELASMAGMSEAELLRYENAIEPIPASVLVFLASLMGVNVRQFFNSDSGFFGTAEIYMAVEDEQPVLLS